MKPIEMLIFDVDGTLVIPENDEVPASCIKALSLARSKGIKITIATGRNHYALGESLNQLKPDYVVGCCGCSVVDCHNDTMIDTHTISLHDTNLLTESAIRYDLSLMFKFDDAMYFYTKPQGVGWLTEDYKKTVNGKYMVFGQTNRHLNGTLPFTAMMFGDDTIIRSLIPLTDLQFIPASAGGYDIVPNGINKATGISALAEYLNMDLNAMVGFGDHHNDMEMFDLLANTVAMGNAVDALKDKASYVTTPVDQNGIANALIHLGIVS